jgi:hypothetical protein
LRIFSRQPADRGQRGRVDAAAIEVEIVADVEAHDASPDDMVVELAHGEDAVDLAFHRDRRADDARRLDDFAQQLLTGGLRPTTVKKEKGAMLGTPSTDKVLSQPIARGTIVAMRSL